MEEFDPVAIIAVALDRAEFGSSDLHGPDPEAAADVRAILSLLKGGQEEEAAQYADGAVQYGWVTVGGKADAEKGTEHSGGTPVEVSESGRVEKGPPGLKGKKLGGGGTKEKDEKSAEEETPGKLKIEKVKGENFKWFGYTFKVGDREFGTEEEAKEFIKDKETGRGPENLPAWAEMTPEEHEGWARRNVENWHSMSIPERNAWHREKLWPAVEAKRQADTQRAAEERRKEGESFRAGQAAKAKAEKEASSYKPEKGKYAPGQFKVNFGIEDGTGTAEGIGNDRLYIRKTEHGWVVNHSVSGYRISGYIQNKGAALKVMDRLDKLGDWSKATLAEIGVDAMTAHKASDLSQPEPQKGDTPAAYLFDAHYAFDESQHPRGQPGNAGEFVSRGGGGSGGKGDAPAGHGEGEPKERHGRLKAALESAKGWLTPSGIARKARALAHGVRHPVESLQAGREKVKELVKKYGVSGALVIVGGYTAYYTLAAMNPGILKFPVPLTPTLLTTAKLAGQLEARLRGQPAEAVHHAREEALDVLTALEEVKALVAALGGEGAEIDEAVMRAVLGEMLSQDA